MCYVATLSLILSIAISNKHQKVSFSVKMTDRKNIPPPKGMESYDIRRENDLGALNNEQQEKLNQHKISTRAANEKYLRGHPEIECLLTAFISDVLMERPENVAEFAAAYFNDPKLKSYVFQLLEEKQRRIDEHKLLEKM